MRRELNAQVDTLRRFIEELRGSQADRPHLRSQIEQVIEHLERQTAALQRRVEQVDQKAA